MSVISLVIANGRLIPRLAPRPTKLSRAWGRLCLSAFSPEGGASEGGPGIGGEKAPVQISCCTSVLAASARSRTL